MYLGHNYEPTIILKVVASYNLWTWNAFFGFLNSHNNINVLERSFFPLNLSNGMLLQSIIQLMVMSTLWNNILLMVFILIGQHYERLQF